MSQRLFQCRHHVPAPAFISRPVMMRPPATATSANSDSTASVVPQHAAMATVQPQPRVPFSRANLIRAQTAAQVREPAPARTAFSRANLARPQVATRDVAPTSQRPVFSRANLLRAQAPVVQSPDEIQQQLQQMLAETPETSQTSLPNPEAEAPLPTTTPAPASQGFLGRILGGAAPEPTPVENTKTNETTTPPIEEINSKPVATIPSMARVASTVVQESRVQKMIRERREAKMATRTPIAPSPAPPPPTLITEKPEPPPPPSTISIPDDPTPTRPAPGGLFSRLRTGSVASLSSPVESPVADSPSRVEAAPIPLAREPIQARDPPAQVTTFAQVVQETRVQKMMRERLAARGAARTPIAASTSVPKPSLIAPSEVQKPEPAQISTPVQTRTPPPAPPPIVTQGGGFSRLVGGANASTPVDSPTSAQTDSPLDIPTLETAVEISPLSTSVSRSTNSSRSQAARAPTGETRVQKMMRERMAARSPIVSSPVSSTLKQTDSFPVVAEKPKSEKASVDNAKIEPEAPQPNVTQGGGFFSRFVGGSTTSAPNEAPTAVQINEATPPIAVSVQAPVASPSLVAVQKSKPELPKPEPAKAEVKKAEPNKPEPTKSEPIESTPVSAVAPQGGFFSRFIGGGTTASDSSKLPEISEIPKPEPVTKLSPIETKPVSVNVKPAEIIPVAPTAVAAPQGGGFFSRFIGGAASTQPTITEPVDEHPVLNDASSSANATVNISREETPIQQRMREKMASREPMSIPRTLQIPKLPTIQPPTPIESPKKDSAPSNGPPAGFFDFSNVMVATASEELRKPLPPDLFSSATLVVPTVEVSMSEDTAPPPPAPDSRFLIPPKEKQGEPDMSSNSELDPKLESKVDPVEEKKVVLAAPTKKSAAEADAAAQAEIAAILAEMQAAEEEAARAMALRAKNKPDPDEIARAEIAAILAEAEAAQRAEEEVMKKEAARILAQEEAAQKAREDTARKEAARVLAEEKAAYQRAQEEAAKEAARILAENEAAQKAQAEAAKREAARVLAQAEAARRFEEVAARKEAARISAQAQAAHQRAQEEAAIVLAQAEAAQKAEEEAAKKDAARVLAELAAELDMEDEAEDVPPPVPEKEQRDEKAEAAAILAQLAAELDEEEDDYADEPIDDDDDEIDKLFAKHGLDNENHSDIITPPQHQQSSSHASSVNGLDDDTPPPPPPKDKVFIDTNITPQTLQRIITDPITPSGIPTSEAEIYSRISSLVIWRSISSDSRNSMRARAETGSSIATTTTNRTTDRRTTMSSLGSLDGRVDGDRERGSMSKIIRMSGEEMQPLWLKEGVPEEKDMETRRGFLNKQLGNLLGDLQTMGKTEERAAA